MAASDDVSEVVVMQRIRNRIIEQLELFSSYEHQRQFAKTVPFVHVPYDLINGWEDWSGPDGEFLDRFVEPVFTPAESRAIKEFHQVWDVAAGEVPDGYPPLESVIGSPPWERLRVAAAEALEAFVERGKLAEDQQVV